MLFETQTFDLNGHTLIFRTANKEDAEMLIDHFRTVCGETPFLSRDPEEVTFTVKDEEAFICTQNDSPTNVLVLAFFDGEYIGNCSLMGSPLSRAKHRATLGIGLYQKYTGLGIGRKLIEFLFDLAKQMNLEQIELEVVANNTRAISLYKKLGFEIFGTMPDNVKYKDGSYTDAYFMVKKL